MFAFARGGVFVAGLLITGIGIADVVAGRLKTPQYEEAVRAVSPEEPAGAPSLFPRASERREQLGIARAKLAFYELLTTVGWGLTALGCLVLMVGLLIAPPVEPAARDVTLTS